ncbi:hypothetical protein N9059_01870, partial [bacterium]|nr:hypothetical protein [bacterium]
MSSTPGDQSALIPPDPPEKKPINKIAAILIAGAILGFAGAAFLGVKAISWFFYMSNEAQEQKGASFSGSKKNTVRVHTQSVEKDLERATELIREGNLYEGHNLYINARESLRKTLDKYGHKSLPAQASLDDWVKSIENKYAQSISNTLPDIELKLQHGTFPVQELRKFVQDLEYAGFTSFGPWYISLQARLARERSASALKWMRIIYEGNATEYAPLITKAIGRTWNDYGQFKIIHGIAISPKERKTTWKELVITCTRSDTPLAASTQESIIGRDLPLVPTAISIQFEMHRNADIPTSWDSLPPFKSTAPIPRATLDNANMFTASSLTKTLVDVNTRTLYLAISNQLHTLPQFTLFPRFDKTKSDLIVDGRLNPDHARPMAVRSPNELGVEFSLAAMNASPDLLNDMCFLIANLQIPALAPILTDLAPKLTLKEQDIIVRQIRNAPDFGDYAPILSIIRNSPPDFYPQDAMTALRKNLLIPKIRQVVEKRIKNSNERVQSYFAAALFDEIPENELRNDAADWLTKENDVVAREFFNALIRRMPKLGVELYGKLYDQVSTTLKLTMVRSVRLSNITLNQDIGESLKKAALQNINTDLKIAAYEELSHIAGFRRGWNLLREVESKETKIESLEFGKLVLIGRLDLLDRDEMIQYITPQITCGLDRVEAAALTYFFSKDHDKTDMLQLVAKHLMSTPDPLYLESVASSITRHRLSSLNWNIKKNLPLIREILTPAIHIDDLLIRKSVHQFIGELARSGDKASLDSLKLAREQEKNTQLR